MRRLAWSHHCGVVYTITVSGFSSSINFYVLYASIVDWFIVPIKYTSFPLNRSVKWQRVVSKQESLYKHLSQTNHGSIHLPVTHSLIDSCMDILTSEEDMTWECRGIASSSHCLIHGLVPILSYRHSNI